MKKKKTRRKKQIQVAGMLMHIQNDKHDVYSDIDDDDDTRYFLQIECVYVI